MKAGTGNKLVSHRLHREKGARPDCSKDVSGIGVENDGIKLKDGRVISGRADVPKGNPANRMPHDEVAAKFLDCARFARSD
jgi:hypothetical protein